SATLTGVNFSGANLTGANMAYATITRAVFTGATLTGLAGEADTGIVMSLPTGWVEVKSHSAPVGEYLAGPGANLSFSELDDVNLTGVDLTGVDFADSVIRNLTVTNANLMGTDFTDTSMSFVTSGGLIGTPVVEAPGWATAGGYLVGYGAALAGANLTNANL